MKLDFLNDYEFFAGVPDSLLKPLCNYLVDRFGVDGKHHIIGVNEGSCVALATGYYLSTGKVPVVYMQNSGEGNVINPLASLCNDKVYGIPMIFFIGWRGEPNVHDEPQHIYQGEVTVKLMEDMDVQTFIISKETTEEQVKDQLKKWQGLLENGKQVAFIVKKGALEFDKKVTYKNDNVLLREEIIKCVTDVSQDDMIVSTTGKASRELFEIREQSNIGHGYDFLTVGSMGHSSSIALEIALNKPNKKIWCIDGDGAFLMHMGACATIGAYKPNNLVHIVINNFSHETVGGLPTVAEKINVSEIAKACGYKKVYSVSEKSELIKALKMAKTKNELTFIEVKCAIGARDNLGRPTTTARENKVSFMEQLAK